ncbi:ead/Ea22-like family protein [Edwardsiella piscicida]|uniref:ead/Ea22-like family protein n=1 Tax=Edwardsiella piscicida TaxID=1263550 RepID=UPI00370D3182
MTALNKQALRERYSSVPAPKCPICGVEMTIQRISGLNVTYGCTGATYDDLGSHYAAGRSIADDHYQQSRVTIVDYGDPDVLALLDENEELEKRVVELAEEIANLKAKALYWDADNTESSYDDPTDIAGALGLNPGDHFYVQVAYLDKDREYIVNDDGSVSCTQLVNSCAVTAQKLREDNV